MERDLPGNCGICKTPLLKDKLVVCRSCGAPYHDACWTYNDGRCAVYGCAQARAERNPLPHLSAGPWIAVPDPQARRLTFRDLVWIVIFVVVAMTLVALYLTRSGGGKGRKTNLPRAVSFVRE